MAMDEFLKWAIAGVAGLWMALLSWLGKRQVDRIDHLYDAKAGKPSLDKAIEQLQKHVDGCESRNKDIASEFAKMTEHMGEIRTTLAVLAAKAKID